MNASPDIEQEVIAGVWNFGHLVFGFVSDFDIRISNLSRNLFICRTECILEGNRVRIRADQGPATSSQRPADIYGV
jgi:hypothetical protein